MRKFLRFLNTVKHLRFKQIVYQIFYKLSVKIRKRGGFFYLLSRPSKSYKLELLHSIVSFQSKNEKSFTFLNQTYYFEEKIDWNYSKLGKLWTYNLTYFDFLQQNKMSSRMGEKLIHNFIEQMGIIRDGLDPFPISLRGSNWIKFLSHHKIKNQKIDNALFAQYYILIKNLEFHLLGNHLLENAFSLLFGAFYFRNDKFYRKAKEILVKELKEQILEDGAHFELSPMYHQLMLYRVLDCFNLIKHNTYKNQELLVLFEEKAKIMLGWINTMTFKNGNIPLFNDSANGISPTTDQLNTYAKELCINHEQPLYNNQLTTSGYRKYVQSSYELVVDIGDIGPDYIPGHAHADIFNFELYLGKKPFIVDTGISTYEKNAIRHMERSTASHNTVTINDTNQSQVWGGFRVGQRAKIIDLDEAENIIIATHDGYKNLGIIHQRSFRSEKEKIEIIDNLIGKKVKGNAYFHLHPSITNIVIKKDKVNFLNLECQINFEGGSLNIEKEIYDYAFGFNKTQKSIVIIASFKKYLVTRILI